METRAANLPRGNRRYSADRKRKVWRVLEAPNRLPVDERITCRDVAAMTPMPLIFLFIVLILLGIPLWLASYLAGFVFSAIKDTFTLGRLHYERWTREPKK